MQEAGRVEIVAVVDEAVVIVVAGWQKLGRGTGGPPSKSLDSDENFKPEHTLFCRDLRTFWRSLGKKSAFLGQKQCFLGKKCTITWYILHILLS